MLVFRKCCDCGLDNNCFIRCWLPFMDHCLSFHSVSFVYYTARSISTTSPPQLLHYQMATEVLMASEVEYVSCQELHNPHFTPRAITSQCDLSPGGSRTQSECTSVFHTELASSSEMPLTSMDSLLDSKKCLKTTLEEPIIAARSTSPVTSILSTEALQDLSSRSQDIPGRRIAALQINNQKGYSMSSTRMEPETCVSESVSIPKTADSTVSDQDDVQFIRSIARKKKRPRQNNVPNDQRQDTTTLPGKNISGMVGNGGNYAASKGNQIVHQPCSSSMNGGRVNCLRVSIPHHCENLSSQTSNVERLPNAASQKALHSLSLIENARGGSQFQYTARVPNVTPCRSSAVAPNKAQKQIMQKRKRGQDSMSSFVTQTLDRPNTKSTSSPVQAPELRLEQQSLDENSSTQGMHLKAPYIHQIYLPGANRLASEFGAHQPVSQPTASIANFIPNDIVFQNRPILTTSNSSPVSASMTENIQHRPSLYAVPQWQPSALSTAVATLPTLTSATSDCHQACSISANKGYYSHQSSPTGLQNLQSVGTATTDHIPATFALPQPCNLQQPTARPVRYRISQSKLLQQPYPPNMLVDIAQTCQENFPFGLIAKRHNQPIQKVFDAFSAVIQIPLLQSTVDVPGAGKLGSLRMKKVRGIKGVKELQKDGREGRKGGTKVKKNVLHGT